MRVIETFVISVPREKIPADAKWFMQDRDGLLKVSSDGSKPHMNSCNDFWWCEVVDERFGRKTVSSDAAETVVTREDLMRAYDLVEQGYTLWFGGECPVEKGTRVDYICDDDQVGNNVTAKMLNWKDGIIAWRISQSASEYAVNIDKDVAAANRVTNARDAAPRMGLLTDKLKTRLELLDKMTGGGWPGEADEQFLITEDGKQLFKFEPEKVITRAQWDDYISRKIRVGDKVKTHHTSSTVEVLFVTDKTALVRYDDCSELAVKLNLLTRIPQ